MLQAQLPPKFWPLAIKTAVLLHNLTPSDTLNGKSPYQVLAEQLNWPVKLPYLGHLRAYGCWTTVKDHSAAHGLTGQLVGYEGSNIYLIYLRNGQKIIRSTNVQFDESKIGPVTGVAGVAEEEEIGALGESFDDYFTDAFEHAASDHASPGGEGVSEESESEAPRAGDAHNDAVKASELTAEEPRAGGAHNDAVEASELADEELDTGIPQLGGATGPAALPPALAPTSEPRRSSRVTKLSRAARDSAASHHTYATTPIVIPAKVHHAFTAAITAYEVKTPNSFSEAMSTPQAEEWRRACKSEIKSLEDNKVWLLMDNPDDGSTIIKGRSYQVQAVPRSDWPD